MLITYRNLQTNIKSELLNFRVSMRFRQGDGSRYLPFIAILTIGMEMNGRYLDRDGFRNTTRTRRLRITKVSQHGFMIH
jgi:hypothetical protein